MHKQFNPEASVDVEKEIESHFTGLEAAKFYEVHQMMENYHEAAVEQELVKAAYLENRICYLMQKRFGSDEHFVEWAGQWRKEFPLERTDEGSSEGYPKQVFENESFKVVVDNRAPEGHVTSDDVHFEVIEKGTRQSILGQGNTVHTHDEDGTPKRFLGYEFNAEGVHFFIGTFGRFEMTSEKGKLIESHQLKQAHEL